MIPPSPSVGHSGFLALLDGVQEVWSDAPPILCGAVACAEQPNDPPRAIGATARLVVALGGKDHHAISVRGKRLEVALLPRQCIYFVPEAWTIPFFDSRADVFSIVFLPWCVRLVRFQVAADRTKTIQDYHTAMPLPPAATFVVRALDTLAEQGDGTPIARELLLILLRMVRQHLAQDHPVNQDHWKTLMTWHTVREHIEGNFGRGISRASVAKLFDLHPSYLSKLSKRHSGQTFRQVLEGIRIARARRLLEESDLKLARVAALCGYRDAIRFAKVFRRVTGTTAGRFRALMKKARRA